LIVTLARRNDLSLFAPGQSKSAAWVKRRSAATAHASRRVGVIYGFQNSEMLGADASSVEHYSRLGVRIMQLTYNGHNRVADGCMVAQDKGLSAFGREVLEQMHAQRVLVDLSHSSERTCLDAIQASASPVSITHTGCRALVNLPRNKSDTELRQLAQKGGVVGIYGMPFLRAAGQPMAADLILHIEHAINVCGEEHVGFGSDGSVTAVDDLTSYLRFLSEDVAQRKQAGVGAAGESESVALFLPDLCGPSQFNDLAEHLRRRGHSSSRIERILGGNFLRLMREVWGG
jgi:membrane dipeptidase